MDPREVVEAWMSLLDEFSSCFTEPGRRRFAALATGALLAEGRPLVTEIVTALGLQGQWRSVEAFLEYGAWPLGEVEEVLARLAAACARRTERRLWAVDDLKVLKSGSKIWGACSFHEYTSRSPNRPATVWAHNWLLCGALRPGPDRVFLPTAGRLYMRRSQTPEGERFRTKPELAVQTLRACARAVEGPHLAVFDGGYAVRSVVRPLLSPPAGEPRIEWLTRLRYDARLYAPPETRMPGQPGRPRGVGRALARSERGCSLARSMAPEPWAGLRESTLDSLQETLLPVASGRRGSAGACVRIPGEGYRKPWYLVTSDLGLAAEQVVEFYAARFAQEDAHRDLKQQLGLGAGQGRLKNVVLRTLQLRLIAMTLLRVLGSALELAYGRDWFSRPPWYPQKRRGSLRDIKGVVRGASGQFSQLDWRRPTFVKSAEVHSGSPPALRRAA